MSHVDSPSPVTHVSLCAGYGGIDLGLRRAIPTLRTIAVSEIEAFACANLVAKMEAGLLDCAPIWTDLKTFPWSDFRDRVDICSFGYPCQPFSAAGKRLGAEDPRHLWPFIAAGIAEMRPSVCFAENVEGHISLGLSDVLQDLVGLGYRATWCVASASECGAPHQRKRVFILAHRNEPGWQAGWHHAISSQGRQPHELAACGGDQRGAEELAYDQRQRIEELGRQIAVGSQFSSACNNGGDAGLSELANAGRSSIRERAWSKSEISSNNHACGQVLGQAWPSRPGEQQFAWEPPRVVVDAKSQRAGQRSELRSEECGSGSALSWDVEQSGEGDLVDAAGAGQQAQRDESNGERREGLAGESSELDDAARLRSAEPADGRGQAASWADASSDEAMGNAMLQGPSSEWSSGWQQDGLGEPSDGAMGNATSPRCSRPEDTGADCGDESQGTWREESERAGAMGHPNSPRPQERPRQRGAGIQGVDADGGETADGEIESTLGRDADGPADWLDHAELYVTCDNRTDELRLLGNGVVPACAERAFRLLVSELTEHQP
jgi:site-specific DNA-cytosine methylase